jgi:hypothetical protein
MCSTTCALRSPPKYWLRITVRERGLGGDLAGQGAFIQRDAHDEADAVLEASGQQLIFGVARNQQRDGRSGGFVPYTFVNVSLRRAAASS